MPYDKKEKKGTFQTDQNNPQTLEYEVYNWVKEGRSTKRRTEISDKDLVHVNFMVVQVKTPNGKLYFDTIWGPFPDWEFVEGLLVYDFGAEGSIEISSAA